MMTSDHSRTIQARRWRILCSAAFVALMLPGCGDGVNPTTVRGKVTYKGAPVTYGIINFSTGAGQPFGGPIQSDGSYEFMIPPGEYLVRIDAPEKVPEGLKEGDPLPPPSPRQAPERFADYKASGLTATIAAGDAQQIDFPLK